MTRFRSVVSSFPLSSLLIGASVACAAPSLPADGFIENEVPFIRSAMVFEAGGKPNRTRRGVILPIGHGHWACFDPDLLRWSAIWKPEAGTPPISYDSMAAISFPDEKAKASKPPELRGKLRYSSAEAAGIATGNKIGPDPRSNFLIDSKTPIGPLPREFGEWVGISLCGKEPIIRYKVGTTQISERIIADERGHIQRILQVGPSPTALTLQLFSKRFRSVGAEATVKGDTLHISSSKKQRNILVSDLEQAPNKFKSIGPIQPATPVFSETTSVTHPKAKINGPFTVRNLTLPKVKRPIRPTDLAFLSSGVALLCTFDGDIWRIENLDTAKSKWTRVASGIFEPMSIATNKNDQIFVLGRDQITELIDINGDGFFDSFKCASDHFLQTLHTRDYATSLEIEPDGSFLIAKGGINQYGKGKYSEVAEHRGTILRIDPESDTVEILADGLRLPYVGLRNDGSVFASDQQGHHIPSTPIHQLEHKRPYLGFAPTDFRSKKEPSEPLFYYPYQANRSAAAFTSTTEKAFSDLANTFLQVSWNGRLFGIATPKVGQAFSWNLPLQLDFPTLNGAVHPISGRLYVVGLGISGYKPTTPNLLGLASIEQTYPIPTPNALDVSGDRITVRLNRPLATDETIIPGSPALRLFNIKRTRKYGSGHYRWDGKPGEQQFQPTAFQLSKDRTQLSLEFDLLRKSDILDLNLSVSSGNITVPLHIFSRPDHLQEASSSDLIKIAEAEKNKPKLTTGDPAKGEQLFTQFSCVGCHSLTDEKLTGPPLKSLASKSTEKEIRESIINPTAKITEGYPPSMPSFEGVIPPQDLEHLISFLMTLKE
ncbi:MAG: DUF6797 domain-containing protein [Akkermansiaceae bacterium]